MATMFFHHKRNHLSFIMMINNNHIYFISIVKTLVEVKSVRNMEWNLLVYNFNYLLTMCLCKFQPIELQRAALSWSISSMLFLKVVSPSQKWRAYDLLEYNRRNVSFITFVHVPVTATHNSGFYNLLNSSTNTILSKELILRYLHK